MFDNFGAETPLAPGVRGKRADRTLPLSTIHHNHTLPLSTVRALLMKPSCNNAAGHQRVPLSTGLRFGAKDEDKREKAMEEITFNL